MSDENAKLIGEIKSSVEGFTDKIASKADAETVENMKASLENIEKAHGENKGEFDAIKGELEKLGAEIKKSNELPEKPLTVKEQLRKNLKENAEKLAGIAEGKGGSHKIALKVDSGSIGDRVTFGLREQGITGPQRPTPRLIDLIQVVNGGPGSNPLSWVERNIVSGASAPTLENATKPTRELEWVENKVTSETIAVTTPVSKKALLNLPIIEQEIQNDHAEDLGIVLETQMLRGTGVAPDLNGLITVYAQPFAAGVLAATVVAPDNAAVIEATRAQIANANFIPNVVMLNPYDFAQMNLAQGTDGHYQMPPFRTADGMQVSGMRVVESTLINQDEFLIMDSNRALLNIVEDVTMSIGWVNDQFITNQFTIRTELDAALRVKAHHQPAFVTGSFAAARTALLKP